MPQSKEMFVIVLFLGLTTLLDTGNGEIDLRYVDETVNPCDDFYQFACGNFGKYHVRPENQSSLEIFTLTENELVEIGKDILSSPIHQNDPIAVKKVKTAYKSCVDLVNLDNLHYYQVPEKQIIEDFEGFPLLDNSLSETGKVSFTKIAEIAGKFGIHQMFQFLVKNFDPENYVVLMFPDSADKPQMLRPKTIPSYDEILEKSFKKYSHTRFRKRSEKDPLDIFLWKTAKHFLQIYNINKSDQELESDLNEIKEFAAVLFDGGKQDGNFTKPSDIITVQELQSWTQEQFGDDIDINWKKFLQEQFKWSNIDITDDFEIYLYLPETVYGTLNLVRQTDPKVVKNFILFRTFLYMAPDSDLPMRQAFEEYYKASGLQYYDRSDYCTRKILDVVDSASLSFAVTSVFAKYHFDINKIPKAVKIIKNLKEAFKEALKEVEWLDNVSYSAMIEKLDNIIVYLGYPDFVESKSGLDDFYQNVRICEWDNYGNSQRIRAFKQAYSLSQFLDPSLWSNSPFEVNAYAIRASLRLMVPLAMLESSYFQGNDPIFDYSRFGSILSHEFAHHFDPTGIGYNQNGSMEDLVSDSTLEIFNNKTQCFINQYSSYYVPEVDSNIDGSSTIHENMADNVGLKHALLAFKNNFAQLLSKNKSKKFNALQEFFLNYAITWCSEESYDYLKNLVANDEHSPNRFRVIGTLSNLKEFSDAFSCPVGSKMNPENKCLLW